MISKRNSLEYCDKSVDSFKMNDFNEERSYLPECWSDDKRMDVLFNPFRVRETNPEGWDLKMTFWINLINRWCLHERKCVFTIDEIRHNFIRNERMPHMDCIKLVASHMKRQNKILLKDEINTMLRRNSSTKSYPSTLASWALNSLIVKPISFGWGLITKSDDTPHSTEDKILPIHQEYPLINKETLEILSETVDSCLKTLDVTCMSYSKFINTLKKSVFSEKCPGDASLEIVFLNLESKNKLKIFEESGFKIVKFGTNENEVKEIDITLVKLELTKEVLENEAHKLETKILEVIEEARAALKIENKDKALFLLRRKKRLEKRLHEKDLQIDNIESLCAQLLESGSQQQIVKAFNLANDVLKKNTAKLEDVEIIMSQLDDNLNDVSTINSEINRPLDPTIASEAEEELEQMLKDMENEENQENTNNDGKPSNDKTKQNIGDHDDNLMKQLENLTINPPTGPTDVKSKISKVPKALLAE